MGNLDYKEFYSKDDYLNWEGNWELVEGVAYAMSPSPSFNHQYSNGKIFRELDQQLDNCQKCYAVIETDWEVSNDTVVRPDSMVICYEPDERLVKTPDIIFEIISKSSARKDENLKFSLYEREGVKYYILVYPTEKKAKVYFLKDGKYIKEGDFSLEKYEFNLKECNIVFDFSFIWR